MKVEVKIEPEETKKEFAESEESEIIEENEPKENLRGKFEDYEYEIEEIKNLIL